METVWKCEGSSLPLPSLHLLVPPVRLMSAFMWQVAQQRNVMQYDKLVEFISVVTEIVPELLSSSQQAELVLGLRAKLVLELCRSDGLANLQTIQSHLDKIQACSVDLSSTHRQTSTEVLKTYTNFSNLVQKLLNVPFEKEYFFQEVFPTNYGSAYDQTLQQLVSEFLSRLEQLLPAPDYTQTAAWLAETTGVAEDFGRHLSDPFALKTLLLHHKQLGTLSTRPSCSREDIILSTLALPPELGVEKYSELYSEDDDYDNEEERLAVRDSEDEGSSQSSDIASDDWSPTKKSGHLSSLFICPQCPFAHRIKRRVQEHIQRGHRTRAPLKKKESVRKASGRTEQKKKDLITENKKGHRRKSDSQKNRDRKQKDTLEKKRERKQKKGNSENKKEQRKRKEPTGEDRRFLSTRPVNKNFTEEETKCPNCEKVFELPNQLKTHQRLHTLPYHCSQCEKGFTSKSGYYQHQRLHKRGRIFACAQCNRGFLCTYSLKQHERKHGEGPNHLCAVCGKRFSKVGIVRHMLMHRGERNYLCTTCGKSFLSSGELLLHTRSHTGETPYTCTHCGKGFSSKSHLNVHIRSHTGERPYPCSQCPKRFLTLNCLKRHTLCHNGVKPFKCPNCGKEFSQQGNLKRHLTTHQPDT
ncbi:zinc finger protein 568-like isoform X1 [Centroberyx affinis]|uniref:zinc finger protein 568-like isoform X1 n=1 Tax=Centroberyx affinis TaxID=166261 RepID=UPI003A5C3EF4